MRPELQAMLAGIPLLPPAEQQELFDVVRSIRAQQITTALEKISAGAPKAPIDKRVAKYVALRDARAAANKEAGEVDASYKSAMEAIEHSLIAEAQATGVTGFKTEFGTTYLEERMLASIADEKAFFDFVLEQGDLDFFERRIKVTHINEYAKLNEGRMPPGLNYFREMTMKVRRK